jgi:hypothetical protein
MLENYKKEQNTAAQSETGIQTASSGDNTRKPLRVTIYRNRNRLRKTRAGKAKSTRRRKHRRVSRRP